MKKNTKILIIVAISLVLIGIAIFGGVMMAFKGDFSKLSTVKYVTNTYPIDDEFVDISVESKWADIIFALSEDGKCKVVCHDMENMEYAVAVNDGELSVSVKDQREWYEHISIMSFDSAKITVYLPEGEYGKLSINGSTGDVMLPEYFSFESIDAKISTGDVYVYASAKGAFDIKTTTGDIKAENITAKSVSLSVSTGDIKAEAISCSDAFTANVRTGDATLTDLRCHSLSASGNTGDVRFDNVVAEEKMYAKINTGDVALKKCDAGEIYIQTNTGSVKGSLLSEKMFIAESNTGSVNVPKTTSGGKCEIITGTGSIKITIEK